jgi:SAM-dependent methyltransferase
VPAALPSLARLIPLRHRLREARSRAARQIALWVEHARSSLGIRRGLHAEHAYFKELTAERLARALAARPSARGHKDYRVTFADGSKQIIRCTRDRCYADLMGREMLHRYARVAPILRPGARVLEIASPPMTTGYTGDWLARMVGHSGAVVSIIPDEQGARFAQRRYPLPNLSFEHLPPLTSIQDALNGETDHAFDAIIHLGLPAHHAQRDPLMRELWRVLAPNGWMLAGINITTDPNDEPMHSLRRHLESLGRIIEPAHTPAGPVLDILLRKQPPEMAPSPESNADEHRS